MEISGIERFGNWLEKIAGSLMVLALVGVITFGAVQVFFRYVLNQPLIGSEEMARLFGVWMTFLGASIAVREGSHIKVELFHQNLKPRARLVVDWIIQLFILAFSVPVTVYGLRLTLRSHILKSPALRFPMSILFAAVAVGSFLSCLFLLQKLISGVIAFSSWGKAAARLSDEGEGT